MKQAIVWAVVATSLCHLPGGLFADAAPTVAKAGSSDAVTVADNGRTWTLDNGIVKATINKGNGNMTSLVFHGIETMGGGGYWEETPQGKRRVLDRHGHDRSHEERRGVCAEVAVKGVTGGTVMLHACCPRRRQIRATSKSATPSAAARAAFTPTRASPIRPPTARWASARAAISPS